MYYYQATMDFAQLFHAQPDMVINMAVINGDQINLAIFMDQITKSQLSTYFVNHAELFIKYATPAMVDMVLERRIKLLDNIFNRASNIPDDDMVLLRHLYEKYSDQIRAHDVHSPDLVLDEDTYNLAVTNNMFEQERVLKLDDLQYHVLNMVTVDNVDYLVDVCRKFTINEPLHRINPNLYVRHILDNLDRIENWGDINQVLLDCRRDFNEDYYNMELIDYILTHHADQIKPSVALLELYLDVNGWMTVSKTFNRYMRIMLRKHQFRKMTFGNGFVTTKKPVYGLPNNYQINGLYIHTRSEPTTDLITRVMAI